MPSIPPTVGVTVTETQKGNEFLVNLGSFLSENSKTIAEPIANTLDPEKRKEAKAAEQDNEDALRIAVIEAIATYDTENAKEGTERDESKIKVAKIKASQACRKLQAAGYDDVSCIGF